MTRNTSKFTAVVLALAFSLPVEGQHPLPKPGSRQDHLPRIANATLLVGYPELGDLYLTTGDQTITLPGKEIRDEAFQPSMAVRGRMIAFGQPRSGQLSPASAETFRLSPGTAVWTFRPALTCRHGTVAISPDGSKLACFAYDATQSWILQSLDIDSETVSRVASFPSEPGPSLSWSPDDRHIAFDLPCRPDNNSGFTNIIYVLDVESKAVTQLGIGRSAEWSPSGEQIAFVASGSKHGGDPIKVCPEGNADSTVDIVSLIKPNGTQFRPLIRLDQLVYGVHPVWSPDSKTLLVNKSSNADIDAYDVFLIDVDTGKKLPRIKKGGMPVWGWTEAH